MMLLGVVRHAAISYEPTAIRPWPYKDAQTHVLVAWLIDFIRVFQLPVFFLIAGFFAGYLVSTRDSGTFLRHRWSRLGVPFLVAWPLVGAAVYLTIVVTSRFTAGAYDLTPSEELFASTHQDHLLMHLWFLYYLLILSVAGVAARKLALRVPRALRERGLDLFERHVHRGGMAIAVLGTAVIAYQMESWTLDYHGNIVPAPRLLALYGLVFAFGWLLFLRRDSLKGFARTPWLLLAGAVAAFLAHEYLLNTGCHPDITSVAACTGTSVPHHLGAVAFFSLALWLFAYGFMGVFVRHFNEPSPRWRYVADASYFIYIVHLPLVMVLPLLFMTLPLPALVKLALVVATAMCLLLVVYHYLVRPTFIGKQLNGRRYPRRVSARPAKS